MPEIPSNINNISTSNIPGGSLSTLSSAAGNAQAYVSTSANQAKDTAKKSRTKLKSN